MKMITQGTVLTVLNLSWVWAVMTDQIPNRDSIPLITLFLVLLNLGVLFVAWAEMMYDARK